MHGTLAAAVAGAATAVAVLAPRWGGPPTAAELLRGTAAHARDADLLLALLLALGVSLAASLLPRARGCGWFAGCAGSVLSVGGAGACALAGIPALAAGVAPAVVAFAVVPLLRDRGLLSLVLVPVVASAPALLCVRVQVELADASRLIGSVQARAPLFGSVLLELPEGAGESEALAIALALQVPHRADPVATIAVAEGSVQARWARQLGLPVLRIRGTTAELIDADRTAALGHPGKVRVAATWQQQPDGAKRLTVHAGELAGGRLVLFHCTGTREAALDGSGSVVLDAGAVLPLGGAKVPLPAGARIQGLALSPLPADVYGWFDVPMP